MGGHRGGAGGRHRSISRLLPSSSPSEGCRPEHGDVAIVSRRPIVHGENYNSIYDRVRDNRSIDMVITKEYLTMRFAEF